MFYPRRLKYFGYYFKHIVRSEMKNVSNIGIIRRRFRLRFDKQLHVLAEYI